DWIIIPSQLYAELLCELQVIFRQPRLPWKDYPDSLYSQRCKLEVSFERLLDLNCLPDKEYDILGTREYRKEPVSCAVYTLEENWVLRLFRPPLICRLQELDQSLLGVSPVRMLLLKRCL